MKNAGMDTRMAEGSTGLGGRRMRARMARNGDILPFVDGRSLLARRYKDIFRQIIADSGGDDVAEVRLQLIRRFAGVSVLAEQLEAKIVTGHDPALDEYVQLISSAVRVASRLGLDRTPKDVSPNLQTYLDNRREEYVEQDEDADELDDRP